MPAKSIVPRSALLLKLPQDVRETLDKHLYSELEGRVPQGSYQAFFVTRIQEYFSWKRLPLESFGLQPGFFIVGPQAMLERVVPLLRGENHDT